MDVRLWKAKYKAPGPALTEWGRRIWAATEAWAAGRGGISTVARAKGIAYSTVRRGLKELASGASEEAGRVRRSGRRPLVESTGVAPALDLEVRQLAGALGHAVSRQLVAELLAVAGYSLQANRKT